MGEKVEYKLLPAGEMELGWLHEVLKEMGESGWQLEGAVDAASLGGGALDLVLRRSIEI
jgi:hypothetical protein